MELQIKEYQLPAKIEANFEELKNELTSKVSLYETIVYTETQIKEAKSDRASLNKLKNAIDAERKARKVEYMKPFDEFEKKIKEITTLIDKPIAVIDTQIKAAEEQRKATKRSEIGSLFTTIEHPDWLKSERIFNEKWLNATYKMQDIKDELTMQMTIINKNVETLKAMPEFGFEALEEYKRTLDFNQAIAEGQRLADLQKRKEEAQKAQKEAEEPKPTINPATEEKPKEEPKYEPFEEIKSMEKSIWRVFGGFMTDKQVDALYEWCANHEITLTEGC